MLKPDIISQSQHVSVGQTSRMYEEGANSAIMEERHHAEMAATHTRGYDIQPDDNRPNSAHLLPSIPKVIHY